MSLHLVYGSAVTGDNRFQRPELEKRFMRSLEGGAGIKMFGLRRIGKSTLRLYATEQFDLKARPYAFVDGQGVHSLQDLLGRLAQAMPGEKGILGRARSLLSTGPAQAAIEALTKGTPHEDKAISAYWRLMSDAIRHSLKGAGPKPTLVIDEFSYVIDNMIKRDDARGRDDADKLLASMREWRGDGMTMLLTGSLGLTALARKHKLSAEHLNDLQPFDVPELTDKEARDFIRQATEAQSKGAWTAAHTDEFLRQSGVFYPCFLVRGLLEIGVEEPAAPEAFASIFGQRVRPDLHADFFNQFDRRFKAYRDLPNSELQVLLLPAMKAIMESRSACAQDTLQCQEPFTRVDLSLALTMLSEDGFVHFTEDAEGERLWKPASRLARLWWKRSKLA